MSKNIFADEWRDCLRAHYTHVIRTNDTNTERTLENVMYEVGFSDAELQAMRRMAKLTMRAEDVGDDFTPDPELMNYVAGLELPTVEAEPLPAVDELEPSAEVELIIEEEMPLPEEVMVEDEPESPPDDPNSPTQLSLF